MSWVSTGAKRAEKTAGVSGGSAGSMGNRRTGQSGRQLHLQQRRPGHERKYPQFQAVEHPAEKGGEQHQISTDRRRRGRGAFDRMKRRRVLELG